MSKHEIMRAAVTAARALGVNAHEFVGNSLYEILTAFESVGGCHVFWGMYTDTDLDMVL